MASIIRRLRRNERGAELIEFAIALPVLLLVVFGIIDFGFLFRDYEVLTNAAREGSRLASLADTYSVPDVKSRVSTYATSGGLNGASVVTTVTPVDIPVGAALVKGKQVTSTYPHAFTFIGPVAGLFGGSFGTVTLRATSTMRTEVQAAP